MAKKKTAAAAKKKTTTRRVTTIDVASLPRLPSFCRYLSRGTPEIHVSGPEARDINEILGAIAKKQEDL